MWSSKAIVHFWPKWPTQVELWHSCSNSLHSSFNITKLLSLQYSNPQCKPSSSPNTNLAYNLVRQRIVFQPFSYTIQDVLPNGNLTSTNLFETLQSSKLSLSTQSIYHKIMLTMIVDGLEINVDKKLLPTNGLASRWASPMS